jgi:ferredoxin-NADP reductase
MNTPVCDRSRVSRPNDRTGFRPFLVKQIVRESETIKSFYLLPDDGAPLVPFKPGQHITLRLEVPGQPAPVLRSYTLSDQPSAPHYRVTIKHEAATEESPPGLGSSHLHERLACGARLWASPPAGTFHLDPDEPGPVALISAGVGLTPMVSMLSAIVANGGGQPVWFVHAARSGREHAMGPLVRRLARQGENVRLHVCYSRPSDLDRPGRDFDSAGRIDGALLQGLLPHLAFEFYLCGPGQFIDDVRDELLARGVDRRRIHSERFVGASPHDGASAAARVPVEPGPEEPVQVRFARSGMVAQWLPGTPTLLDLAEAQGLAPDSACRSGLCQICMQRLLDGEVTYATVPATMPEEGFILPCCAQPVSDLVVDL